MEELDLVEILQKTITGTAEEIEETSNFLSGQQGNPDYISCLLEIISNSDVEEKIRLAAAIQLKIQVQNDSSLQIEFSTICALIGNSPIRVQLQLQIILYSFVKKKVDAGEIENLASTSAELFEAGGSHALVSVLILRYLINLAFKKKNRPSDANYEFIKSYIPFEQFFEPISNLILSYFENKNILNYSLLIHSSLHMVSKYLKNIGPIASIENWVEIITQIINNPSYESPLVYESPPFLDKDAIKLACYLYEYLPPEINGNLLLAIATHSIKGASFQTIAMSFRFLNLGLSSIEIWPMIEPHQYDLVGGLFFRTFTLTKQDLNDAKENLYTFISTTQVSCRNFRTPRNGAESSFLTAVQHHESLAQCAIQIVLCEFESFKDIDSLESEELRLAAIGKIYGALQFATIALKNTSKAYSQKYARILYETAATMLEIDNCIYTAGFFQFISLMWESLNDVEILFRCFEAIVNLPGADNPDNPDGYVEDPERDLVQYFASCAAANMLANFKKDPDFTQIQSEVISNGSLKPLLSNVLRICKLYATDQSAGTLRLFTGFFVGNIAPVAIEYMSELFSIFLQYANDPRHYVRISITCCQVLISTVSHVIHEQREDISPSFFSEALEKIEEVALECDQIILEEVLELIACFSECMTEISEPFIKVPQVLLGIIERDEEEYTNLDCSEFDLTEPNSPSDVKDQEMPDKLDPLSIINVIKALIKINPDVVTSTPDMILPIFEMAKYFLAQFNNSESPDCAVSVPLFQIIFIKLKDYQSVTEFAPMFLEMLDEVDSSFLSDVVAALVYFSPTLTLISEKNFEFWMNSHPAAFLLGALRVIECWDSLHEQITQLKDQVGKKITENLQKLKDNSQTDECEDKDIFNFQSILESFSKITF